MTDGQTDGQSGGSPIGEHKKLLSMQRDTTYRYREFPNRLVPGALFYMRHLIQPWSSWAKMHIKFAASLFVRFPISWDRKTARILIRWHLSEASPSRSSLLSKEDIIKKKIWAQQDMYKRKKFQPECFNGIFFFWLLSGYTSRAPHQYIEDLTWALLFYWIY